MRRLTLGFLAILTALLLATGACAATEATQMNVLCTVSSEGTCQITASVTVHLEAGVESLEFPVPREAVRISLNGSRAHARAEGAIKNIDLSGLLGNFTGDVSFTLNYTLPGRVLPDEDGLLHLRLPIMSGFAYPTQNLEFQVTLPGNVEEKPGFSSGYHQANIEQDLSCVVDGAVITGRAQKALKDHETLEMILPVTETMFPQRAVNTLEIGEIQIVTRIFLVLALVYWLLFLRNLPAWSRPLAQPPEGCSAGQLLSLLALEGADLHMMVFTWAKLGYVLLETDRKGRVRIYKQMDMGNERSPFERKCFKNLFGARHMVDTGGRRYGALCQKIRKLPPDVPFLLEKRSGNRRVFRFLCSCAGLCSGVSLGISLVGEDAALLWPISIGLGLAGFLLCYQLQLWVKILFSPFKYRLFWVLLGILLWIVPSCLVGRPDLGLTGAGAGILGGLLYFIAGRRTAPGRSAMNGIMGLMRSLYAMSPGELEKISGRDPEYFFRMAPYAMALGVDLRFARHFGSRHLPECPYIRRPGSQPLTALRWARLMRAMADSMDAGRRQAPLEQFQRIMGRK